MLPTLNPSSDEAYRSSMSSEEWATRIAQYYEGSLWNRRDILPMRAYLTSCLSSAFSLGGNVWLDSMLDSNLSDGSSVREYVRAYPERFRQIEDILP
jgi:hypothetical protein